MSVRSSLRNILLSSTLTLMATNPAAAQAISDAEQDQDFPELHQTAAVQGLNLTDAQAFDFENAPLLDGFTIPETILSYNTDPAAGAITDPLVIMQYAAQDQYQKIPVTQPMHYRELLGLSGATNLLNTDGDVREGGSVSTFVGVVVDLNPDGSLTQESINNMVDVHNELRSIMRGDEAHPSATENFGAYVTAVVPVARNPENLNRPINTNLYDYAYARADVQNPGAADDLIRFEAEPLQTGGIAILMNNGDIPREGLVPLNEDTPYVRPVNVADYVLNQPLPTMESDNIKIMMLAMYKGGRHLASEEELSLLQQQQRADATIQNQSLRQDGTVMLGDAGSSTGVDFPPLLGNN